MNNVCKLSEDDICNILAITFECNKNDVRIYNKKEYHGAIYSEIIEATVINNVNPTPAIFNAINSISKGKIKECINEDKLCCKYNEEWKKSLEEKYNSLSERVKQIENNYMQFDIKPHNNFEITSYGCEMEENNG